MDIERRLLFAERQRTLVFAHPHSYATSREATMGSIFMKMMAHRQQRRTSLGVAFGVEAHPQREHVVAGRLMSYGISSAGAYREGRRDAG
jgi:hypothetical protein